ncbi:MAG: hypothetical protein GEU95_21485 [Rhizobiales bacterium]|nr:hypothetical protein [Hyphomicrobiales bacterium]
MLHISLPYMFVAATLLEKIRELPDDDTAIEDVAGILIGAHQQMIDLHASDSLYATGLRSAPSEWRFCCTID